MALAGVAPSDTPYGINTFWRRDRAVNFVVSFEVDLAEIVLVQEVVGNHQGAYRRR